MLQSCQKKLNEWGDNILEEFLAKWSDSMERSAFKSPFTSIIYVVLWIDAICASRFYNFFVFFFILRFQVFKLRPVQCYEMGGSVNFARSLSIKETKEILCKSKNKETSSMDWFSDQSAPIETFWSNQFDCVFLNWFDYNLYYPKKRKELDCVRDPVRFVSDVRKLICIGFFKG